MNLLQAIFICFVAAISASCAQTMPAPSGTPRPNPEPQLPGNFDPFTPPITAGALTTGAPAIAEWTRTGKADSVVGLTGSRLSSFTGTDEGKDTQFLVYAQNAKAVCNGTASVLRLDGLKAAIVLPADLPANSEAFLWPVNSAGMGAPVAINATNAWWVGPNAATRGASLSVYGRNLGAMEAGVPSPHVYLQKLGLPGEWATVTAANPYKVDFTVPANLADGVYQVWTHNGHGGHYGWSGPLLLTINNGTPWTTQQFNVKNYGAKGDGTTDDQAAIGAALQAASRVPWSTLYLPTGTYMVSRGFTLTSQVRWSGDGPTKTIIRANANFVKPALCLLFNDSGVNDVVVQNLTLDANGNLNGYLGTPVHVRFANDLCFSNVAIDAKGYQTADFHGTNLLSLQNCSLTGGGDGVFFGSATQVQVNGCHVYGTNDVNTMLNWWGGNGMSITNTTAQDFDPTQPDGFAQGRFIYGSSNWGSNRNVYIGNNTTKSLAVRPGFSNQNTGEQLLWENGTRFSATAVSAGANTVTFAASSFFSNPDLLAGRLDAVVVNGPGLGQHRRIIAASGSTIVVSPDWNVAPDATSTVIMASVADQCAVYHNTLEGKPDYATRDTASTGVEPYGNSYDFIVDSNTISQMRTGISLWSMSETSVSPQSIDPLYFSFTTNNTVRNCVNGISGSSQAWNGWPAGDPYPGLCFLANTCSGNTITSSLQSGLICFADTAPVGDQMDANIFEHNSVSNAPNAIDLTADAHARNAIAYHNVFSRGVAAVAGSVGLALGTGNAPDLRDNTYAGFANTYTSGSESTQALEAPSHVLAVSGSINGTRVTVPLTLWNAGTTQLAWSITTDAPWLTAAQSTGTITNESDAASVVLTCDPAGLAAGTYFGNVTVQGPGLRRTYEVKFSVGSALAAKATR